LRADAGACYVGGMKVLVTGASGFLGGWVAQRLSERGHVVRALVRKSSQRKHLEVLPDVEFAEGAIENAEAVKRAVEGVDAVIHSAGLVKARNEAEFRRTNVEGTRNLVVAAREAGALRRFVLVSSLEAAGPSSDASPVPVHQQAPITAYGRSKLAAEKVAIAHKDSLATTILRPGAIYGPRDQEILEAFKSVKRGLLPMVDGGVALGSFIFGPDCADACIHAVHADLPSGSILHVTDGNAGITQKDFLGLIERAIGRKALVRANLPRAVLKAVAYGVKAFGAVTNRAVMLTPEKANMLLQHFHTDGEGAMSALNWRPKVPLHEGVQLSVQWYREQGWL
jgi:nucleoside-diphosphate-sugar epimerase